jgi:hypothetical protein
MSATKKQRREKVTTEPQNFVCVYCRKDGLHPDQNSNLCIDGFSAHVITPKNVFPKTYFLAGPTPQRYGHDERGPLPLKDRTIITGIPPTIYPPNFPPGGDEQTLNGGQVEFVNNRYTTSDAVEQFWLDKRGEDVRASSGTPYYCTEAEWEQAWLSTEELREREFARRTAEVERLEHEIAELRKRAAKGA